MADEYTPTDAFVGKAFLAIGNGDSPEMFTRFCEVYDIGEFGEKNDQVDATTFCSGGYKQYIAGLSDGSDFSFAANYALDNTIKAGLIQDVKNKKTRNVQIQMGDDSPISEVFSFALSMLSWGITPSLTGKNTVKFEGKISGPIDISTST